MNAVLVLLVGCAILIAGYMSDASKNCPDELLPPDPVKAFLRYGFLQHFY